MRALVADLAGALTQDKLRVREALRAALGEIKLVKENGIVYAEFQDVAERMMMTVGGEFPNLVAGAGFEPATFGL